MIRLSLPLVALLLLLSACSENPFSEASLIDSDAAGTTATPITKDKLRHGQLASRAHSVGVASKGAQEAHVFVAYDEYEPNGVTRRVLDSYGITRRVLEEYGITRRVLDSYGITRRVLEEYGVTRRVLESYGVTRRVLESYGVSAAMLEAAGYVIDEAFLASRGLTMAMLESQGVTRRVLDEYGVTRRVLDDYNISDSTFDADQDGWHRTIRLKVRIDAARPGIFLGLGSLDLTTFLEEVADDLDIEFVEPDPTFDGPAVGTIGRTRDGAELLPWGVAEIGALESPREGVHGVQVYVLDSGVYDNDLNIVERKDFTMLFLSRGVEFMDDSAILQMPFFDPGDLGNPEDGTGHGTHIAGTIGAKENGHNVIGAAPGAGIISLKVMTPQGKTDVTTVLAAIDYVIARKLANPNTPMVINMSLGMDIESTEFNVLDEGVRTAVANGITVVVSAGNDTADAATYSPAHVPEAITVASVGQNDAYSDFSNFGPVVDLVAPGEMIASLSNDPSDIASNFAVLESGTSMAAAHVSAAAALVLLEYPNASPQNVAAALVNKATPSVERVPAGTTNLMVWAGPGRDEDPGERGTPDELPPFLNYAITAGGSIQILDTTHLSLGFEAPNTTANASVFTNKFVYMENGESQIAGFAYQGEQYHSMEGGLPPGDVENWVKGAAVPNYNPSELPGSMIVPTIDIPELWVGDFKNQATIQSTKGVDLAGHYDLGTAESPMVWYINGDLKTRGEVTFSGYGVFLVKGEVEIRHDVVAAEYKTDTTLGIYSQGHISFKSEDLAVAAQIFTNSDVVFAKRISFAGNITAGGRVFFGSNTANEFDYRPAPAAITEIFWPMHD